jgi:hypothetical protein
MPELPPHLLRYKMNHKYDFGGPSLLGVEDDEGRVEYKLRLKDPTPNRFHQLVRGPGPWACPAWVRVVLGLEPRQGEPRQPVS